MGIDQTYSIFQSTPSTRRETRAWEEKDKQRRISIHSLHTEGDCVFVVIYKLMLYFNPLPPHGGRPQNCTGKRFSFRLSLYNPAKKDAKDYILHPKK